MIRTFEKLTEEEINKRKLLYQQADELGIDLMSFDTDIIEADERRDIRKAIVLLGTDQEIPEDLRNRLLAKKKNIDLNKYSGRGRKMFNGNADQFIKELRDCDRI